MKKNTLSKIFTRNYIIILILFLLSLVLTITAFYFENEQSKSKVMLSADKLMNDDYKKIDYTEISKIGGGLYVIDRNYNLLRSVGKQIFTATPIPKSEFTDFLVSADDSSYDISVKYNEHNNFWLIITRPRQVRFEILLYLDNSSGYTSILFFFIAVIICLSLSLLSIVIYSILTSASLKKPLSQLRNEADCIKSGCYELPAPDSNISEIHNVQEAFYLMSEKISHEINHTKQNEENLKKLMLDISHDLKNPLMSIKGYADLIKNLDWDAEKKKIEQYVDIISENSSRADKLVKDLFLLAKMENAKDVFNLVKMDITELLKATLIERYDELEASGLRTVFDIPDQEVNINGDAEQLKRAISNILDNALKYREENTALHISLLESCGYVRITFTNGTILKHDNNNNLTKAFVRSNHAKSLSPEGAGLGLSIVEKIITLHGGTVSCGYKDKLFEICLTIPDLEKI
ncbi:sensor histidine kinase [Anaerocolumna sp. MB42-C2]|uniref:sensor histidine kinase n=1 Tax=Anaerocolumna sp. MB42-C2 TaxID=3070997 RepID=UPI0027E04202|nr:HAMP domain-containing sensor histidine kinase [Anaerocolumna sp. MB42-C2]WMJ89130.1 HAMP domain-containing sensor histidine kinase [Anaerocolumna sp. MB42-C2]